MRTKLALLLVVLVAAPVWPGEVNLSGFVSEAPGDMFNDGVGFQADYTQTVSGNWFATGGVSYNNWNIEPYGWDVSSKCTSLSYELDGAVSDTRLFVGGGYSALLRYGVIARLSADVGYDFINSDVSDVFTVSRRWHTMSMTNDFDAQDTWTGRINLRLLKPLSERFGVSMDVAYVHDFNDQELTVGGHETGLAFDRTGFSFGLGAAIQL